ncbi:MAG: response regulator [Methanobacteriota archaeon]|nr:MAG: response regulator [Euryarchaeota archaeon]
MRRVHRETDRYAAVPRAGRFVSGGGQRSEGGRGAVKIVVVEDEPTNLKLAHIVLAAEGHDVRDAEEGERALELIRREKPDILVTDLAMPKLDGLALIRKLKADPATRNIRIIAVTAYPDRFPEEAARAAGCDAYIMKPIDTRRFRKQIDEVAERVDSIRDETSETRG